MIIGVLTTIVNLVCFHVFINVLFLNITFSNVCSIVISILFAFVANKYYVFKAKKSDFKTVFFEFVTFIAGRLLTMVVEVGGVFLLYDILSVKPMIAKVLTTIIVVILNYLISKFLVFN